MRFARIFRYFGILATPGSAFGKGTRDCIRLSFATSIEEMEKALTKIKEVL
jgi:aspartate/methionine/tyrosine aminotransferase